VREGLVAAVEKIKARALDTYLAEMQVWAAIAPHTEKKPPQPEMPTILKSIIRGNT
jgi:hypothetical protein